MWAWRLTCSSWTSRSVSWSWMWARPPRSSWRVTAGQVRVWWHTILKHTPNLLHIILNTEKILIELFVFFQGFYELSDGGSCSLSNSCNSVYSESLSSSQTSLLLAPISPSNCHVSPPPPQVDVCRRRSADESTTQPNPPRGSGLHLGSSRIRASATGSEQARPRPVSTGNDIS